MEHLLRFWQLSFNKYADFRPNYSVANINSILRFLSGGQGLAIIIDFLFKKEVKEGKINVIWERTTKLTNTLYFGCRKNTQYASEIHVIKNLFKAVMVSI